MSQLMSLVEDTMKASKREEPAGTMEGAADRGDARESAAAESTNVEGGAPWTENAQDGRYLREPVRDSGPSGRHSGEAGGFVRQEVRVAAAHNQGYQSVRYSSPPFSGKWKDFNEWLNDEQVELAFHAWNFLSHALKEKYRNIMKRAETPQGALRELKTIHDPESSVQPSEDLKSLTSTKISRGEKPQNALSELPQTAKSLTEKGLTVNETFVLHLFLDALSDGYAMTKHNLRHAKELTRTGVLKEVIIKYKAIKEKLEQGKGKGAKGAEQAYFADGEGCRERYSSGSQGQGRGRGGGRGRSSSLGRGGGGRGGRSGGSGGVEESKGSSSGGADGGGGGDYRFLGRCFRCGHRGHQAIGCTTNEKDFVPWCARCEGWGHTKEKCATEEAGLAQVAEHESDVDSVDDQAYCAVAVPPGGCGTVGEVGLVGVVEQGQAVYVADTAATCSMFRCADNFVNYRERSGWVKGIGGDKAPVPLVGYGDVTLVLQTEDGGVPVPVLNAVHVPEAPYNLLSPSSLAEEGHTYSGTKGGLTLTTKAGWEVWFPRTGKLLTQQGYQIKPTLHTACAPLIVPGDAKAANPTDFNEYHLAHGHAHETLPRITTEQQGVQLTDGPLLPCLGCSMSKGQAKPVQKSTSTRALLPLADDERAGRARAERMNHAKVGGRRETRRVSPTST
ncbi:unnamed protein product [Ectocarpus sp. CCAP 1310/34]|nr:unnamed protein product [Ectocarpus sp. CCAP 1310/34]